MCSLAAVISVSAAAGCGGDALPDRPSTQSGRGVVVGSFVAGGGLSVDGSVSTRPAANTTIVLAGPSGEITVTTDAHGKFETKVAAGSWNVTSPASTPEHTIEGQTTFMVEAGETTRIELESTCNVC